MTLPTRPPQPSPTFTHSGESSPPDPQELRQRRWELRRVQRVASHLAELLELAGRTADYIEVRTLERRVLADLMALDGSDDLL